LYDAQLLVYLSNAGVVGTPLYKICPWFSGFNEALPGVFENGKAHGVYETGKEDWTEMILLVTVVQYDLLTRVRVGRKGR